MNEYIQEILKPFLSQAETNDLKTKHYPKNYSNLKVEVSFGQGVPARIPWISFLADGQTTSNGIYPVYLFFKEYQQLILAYGVSETKQPQAHWTIDPKIETVANYFNRLDIVPKRYGSSYVYAVYDVSKTLDWNKIEEDLHSLIEIYQTIMQSNGPNSAKQPQKPIKKTPEPVKKTRKPANKTQKPVKKTQKPGKKFEINDLKIALSDAGLKIPDHIVTRFICSLLTKPFVILTGLSGSGKTKLAQAFAEWICESDRQYCLIPVGADWTNREPLLGFPNALNGKEYIKPDNGALDLMINASKDQEKPYFLILDEMNLSHVERYFADFLSSMESTKAIYLHAGPETRNEIPPTIDLPKNLFIIGTVNIDETTYMFSPKVLDRANVIEFRIGSDEMTDYLANYKPLNLNDLKFAGRDSAKGFIQISKENHLDSFDITEVKSVLIGFFEELRKTGAEFGFRSASEIIRFASIAVHMDTDWSSTDILDAAIMQKLLPKVHGSRRKLEPVLKTLGGLCMKVNNEVENIVSEKDDRKTPNETTVNYPLSYEKIQRMHQNLISNGFTSYAEA